MRVESVAILLSFNPGPRGPRTACFGVAGTAATTAAAAMYNRWEQYASLLTHLLSCGIQPLSHAVGVCSCTSIPYTIAPPTMAQRLTMRQPKKGGLHHTSVDQKQHRSTHTRIIHKGSTLSQILWPPWHIIWGGGGHTSTWHTYASTTAARQHTLQHSGQCGGAIP